MMTVTILVTLAVFGVTIMMMMSLCYHIIVFSFHMFCKCCQLVRTSNFDNDLNVNRPQCQLHQMMIVLTICFGIYQLRLLVVIMIVIGIGWGLGLELDEDEV